jgi:Domain of unknown function (DUF4403)
MKQVLSTCVIFIFLLSCGGSKKLAEIPAPVVDNFKQPDLYSYININYKINKKGLTDTFNFVLDEMSKAPMVFPDYDVTTKLKRSGNVTIAVAGKDVWVTLPLDVEVLKKTFIKDFKANGTLELSFKTNFNIDKFWNLSTKTALLSYQWTKKPKIDLGVINLPIETIANMIIGRSKTDLEYNIDQSIKETYDLKSIIGEVAKYTLTPYELDSVFGGWMQMVSDSAFFTPAVNTKTYTEGKISMKTKMNITTYKPKEFKPALPTFAWKDNLSDSSEMKFLMELEYDHMTNIARKNFVGQKFSEGGKEIEVLDVIVGKKDGRLEVTTKVKGSFNGDLSVRGIPEYDKTKKLIYARDIDVSVKTGNVLYKAAAWLLKGKIKSQLDEMLKFPIGDQMTNFQTQVDQQILAMNKKYHMNMKVKLGKISMDNVILRPDRANAYITLKMRLETVLEDLSFFRD